MTLLLFIFNIGEPEVPIFVLHLCIKSYFLSSNIFSITPNETDNSP